MRKELKLAYPVLMKKTDDGYYVEIPDFDIATQGSNVAEAMEMARDAIGLMGIDYQDDKKDLPEPYSIKFNEDEFDIETLVDINLAEYRRKLENKSVKKNCTIPYWLNEKAEKEGINFSKLLQEAVAKALGVSLK
ncbi:type II toxin-antitoxin system HicB family antitoxin [Peptostreptococcus equinus]|uniref:Type II toxin-antitoxin system HicB family antitoxin n=1 Tax=Peptostreptococcus equinus TaxID=3003601 RepID=A0ABY7JRH4_9FIRM|nr:type II toxin-antitoxin system HicB family antitoxin [Peptostreptococcus sp. CBA3647]WAW15441.1 type II toxin-antitoxin system HicB family antitoxin [Peptostreptococcus sp. CBA3647]